MRKIIAILLVFVLFMAALPLSTHAENTVDVPMGLAGIDEVTVLKNNDDIVSVKGKEGSTTVIMTYDKNTSDVTMESIENDSDMKKAIKDRNSFNLQLDPENIESFEVSNTVEYQGKSYDLEKTPDYSEYRQARGAAAIPLAVALGGSLLKWIISQFASIVIAGITYVVASAVISDLQKKNYDHFLASLRSGKLYIGNSITYASATARLKSGGDVWSKTNALAKKVAQGAGGGKVPVGVERHDANGSKKNDYYWHFHAYNRVGGHSFYGVAVKGKK